MHLRQLSPPSLLPPPILPNPTLSINLRLARDNIRLGGINKLSLVPDLPERKHDNEEPNRKVTRDEPLCVPGREHVESVEESDGAADYQSQNGPVGHQWRDPGEVRVPVDVLGAEGAVPEEEDDDHAGVCEHEAAGGQVDEPVEDLDGGGIGGEVGDAGEEGDGEDAVDGDAGLGALEEELGGLAVLCEGVEGSAGGVDVCVSAGPAGEEDEDVDEVGEAVDVEALDSDDPWGGGGATAVVLDGAD